MKVDTKRLRPLPAAIVDLAKRETDPARARAFEPIVRGPFVAALLLVAIGIYAVVRAIVVLGSAALGAMRR